SSHERAPHACALAIRTRPAIVPRSCAGRSPKRMTIRASEPMALERAVRHCSPRSDELGTRGGCDAVVMGRVLVAIWTAAAPLVPPTRHPGWGKIGPHVSREHCDLVQALVFGWGARGERPRSPRTRPVTTERAGIDRQGNALHAPSEVHDGG